MKSVVTALTLPFIALALTAGAANAETAMKPVKPAVHATCDAKTSKDCKKVAVVKHHKVTKKPTVKKPMKAEPKKS